jgi:hypothetical protein
MGAKEKVSITLSKYDFRQKAYCFSVDQGCWFVFSGKTFGWSPYSHWLSSFKPPATYYTIPVSDIECVDWRLSMLSVAKKLTIYYRSGTDLSFIELQPFYFSPWLRQFRRFSVPVMKPDQLDLNTVQGLWAEYGFIASNAVCMLVFVLGIIVAVVFFLSIN